MDISKLEEAQGLDEAMLKRWLINTGWSHYPGELIWLHKLTYATLNFKKGLAVVLDQLCAQSSLSPQAFLCHVNPRLRKGVPSEEARTAHSSLWLAFRYKEVRVGKFTSAERFEYHITMQQAAVRALAASEPKNFLTREAPIERATECAILRRWKVAG